MPKTLSLPINPANPAEFFGACGLLELASGHGGGEGRFNAEGWFDAEDTFHLITEADGDPVSTALYALDEAKYVALETSSADSQEWRASPLKIGDPVNIRLDWWKSHEALKTFAGLQKSVDIYGSLLREAFKKLLEEEIVGQELWNAVSKGVKGLGLDAYRSWTALNMGFSLNELKKDQQSPDCRPAVELLAMIGLQRMRPVANPNGIEYWTWDAPLSASVAGAAVTGQVEFARLHKYEARFQKNGQNKIYLVAEKSD